MDKETLRTQVDSFIKEEGLAALVEVMISAIMRHQKERKIKKAEWSGTGFVVRSTVKI